MSVLDYISQLENHLIYLTDLLITDYGDVRSPPISCTTKDKLMAINRFVESIESNSAFWNKVEKEVSRPATTSYNFESSKKKHTRIRLSFKSPNQSPDFMIIKETYINGKINWADIIYQEETLRSELAIEGEIEFEKMTTITPIL